METVLLVLGGVLAGLLAGVLLGRSSHVNAEAIVQLVKTSPIFVDSAKEVIQFAVGNLDPKAIKGWPHEKLRIFADYLELHAGAAQTSEAQILRELATELKKFANEAQNEEVRRGPKPLPGILPTVPVVPPEPLSGEAKRVWDAAMAGRLMAGDTAPTRSSDEITVPGGQTPTSGELKSGTDLPSLPLVPPPLPPVE